MATKIKPITKLLVANRGEIAIRIFRACRELGIETVAVYSDVDRDSPHVRFAGEAHHIGGTPPADSYLNIDNILDAAKRSSSDALHPGYGFLAENADFADAVNKAGLIWIGPPPEAIKVMGDKVSARKAAAGASVPSVPGTDKPVTSVTEIEEFGAINGWPVAIKAAYGGGGRGFRVVEDGAQAGSAFEAAQREAQMAFGNPAVYLERYLSAARHVEIQVIADSHGNTVHLGERDCSLQRRHQKLIEESPSPAVTHSLRADMGAAAVAVAEAAGYQSVGTVEFLLEAGSSPKFWFLEMNTRLQVEHPVTEMVCGIDLAKEMIRVASGETLSFGQADVAWTGHAIECRINAEDAARNFLPSPGLITGYTEPGGPGVRVDSGVVAGVEIPQSYDSLMAKLICHGSDRKEAIARSLRALEEFSIQGLKTTLPFHQLVLASDWFATGNFHTKTIEDDIDLEALRAVPTSAAKATGGRALATSPRRSVTVEVEGKRFDVTFTEHSSDRRAKPSPPDLSQMGSLGTGEVITAPMQGSIVKTLVSEGDEVAAGDGLVVLEAMKMENLLTCKRPGVVNRLLVSAGETVQSGAILVELTPLESGK